MPAGTSRFILFGAAAAALGLLLACQVGPDYSRPKLDVPTVYKSAATQDAATQPSLATAWWRLFNDPDLTRLEEAALRDNPDLKAAVARVAEARAAAAQVASQYDPQITFDPSIAASYSGKTNPASPNHWTSPTRLPFDLSYEVDLWGQVARSLESAKAGVRATAGQYAVVMQTLAADVAQDYVNLRALEDQDAILTENIKLTQEQLDLIKKKAQPEIGLAGNIDVAQAQTQLDALRTQQMDVHRQRTDAQHALAILVGQTPADFSLVGKSRALTIPSVPPGLPADILRRRPDVVAAEQNLVAANAQIGVALANFYPAIRLSGSAGMASVDVQHVMDWQSALLSLGPSVSIPIFEGGRLQAGLDQAEARYDELLATYRSTLLAAFRDVEVSLTDVHMRADELEMQHRAVASAREYLRLSRLEYDQGLVSYLQLLDSDRTLLGNELTESQLLNQRLVSTVLLIKALGGGWDADAPLAYEGAARPEGSLMHDLLAYADSRDTSLSTMVLLLYSVLWIAVAAFLAAIPLVVSRRRAHRHASTILAIMLFWGLAAAGSACATLAARNQWSRDETVLLESGYYDPREHRHDPPRSPWALWGLLAGAYVGAVLWSLNGKRPPRPTPS